LCTRDGWLVWLRRLDNSLSFDRTWKDYKHKFGSTEGNFWLGLVNLHQITNKPLRFNLRCEMESWRGEKSWAEYKVFYVHDESDNYKLTVAGYNSISTAQDSLSYHNTARFTTKDKDGDAWKNGNCAEGSKSGWWFGECATVFATSKIVKNSTLDTRKVDYMSWGQAFGKSPPHYEAIKSLVMMIRPAE